MHSPWSLFNSRISRDGCILAPNTQTGTITRYLSSISMHSPLSRFIVGYQTSVLLYPNRDNNMYLSSISVYLPLSLFIIGYQTSVLLYPNMDNYLSSMSVYLPSSLFIVGYQGVVAYWVAYPNCGNFSASTVVSIYSRISSQRPTIPKQGQLSGINFSTSTIVSTRDIWKILSMVFYLSHQFTNRIMSGII